MKMRIVAVDPGGTTGVICGFIQDGSFTMEGFDQYGLGDLGELDHFVRFGLLGKYGSGVLCRKALTTGQAVLIVESFILTAGSPPGGKWDTGLAPVHVTGWLLGRLNLMPGVVVFQSASSAKSVVNDARLRSAGGWITGKQHARDAYRHAELYARTLRGRNGH